jgi:hypothetical protein
MVTAGLLPAHPAILGLGVLLRKIPGNGNSRHPVGLKQRPPCRFCAPVDRRLPQMAEGGQIYFFSIRNRYSKLSSSGSFIQLFVHFIVAITFFL